MAIDIYCWLTMRLLSVRKPTLIPWKSLQEQFGAGYSLDSAGRRDFKVNFQKQLKKVLVVYPEAKVTVPDGKGGLLFSRPFPARNVALFDPRNHEAAGRHITGDRGPRSDEGVVFQRHRGNEDAV